MENKDFEKLLVDSKKALECFANSLTLNKEDANDLVQETFLKALANRNAFVEDSNLRAWLFTIMKNTFINGYRRGKRVQSIVCKQLDNSWIFNIAGDDMYNADHNVRYSQIIKLLDLVPEEQRSPFEMMMQGYKYVEIADRFNIPIGTVKSRIFLARKKLIELLDEQSL